MVCYHFVSRSAHTEGSIIYIPIQWEGVKLIKFLWHLQKRMSLEGLQGTYKGVGLLAIKLKRRQTKDSGQASFAMKTNATNRVCLL